MKWRGEFELAQQAAREAGRLLAELAGGAKEVLSAEGRDIKLKADREAEQLILDRLRGASPHPILAEESGEHGAPEGGPFWVIDPLDGTLNFKRGIPICGVSIALVEGVDPIFGVIYDFNRDELFSGGAGDRARLNGTETSISDIRDPSQAVLATGLPVGRDYSVEGFAEMIQHFRRFKKTRMIGSAAISLAWAACGRVEAYAEDEIMLWDVAAGVAIVRSAGGYVSLEPSPKNKWARRVRVAAHEALWG